MPTATRRRRRPDEDEDVEETRPRRRRPTDDDEEDERPRNRRRPEPEDDEDEEESVEDAPGRRRSRVQDDEEDERPRRRGRQENNDDEDEDEEEDAPSGRRSRRGSAGRSESSRRVASGWGAYERSRAASSDFETKFKPSSELQVVQLLEDGPFHSFARHWVELKDGKQVNKRAFVCPASVQYVDDAGEPVDEAAECPLCDVGHKPNSPKAYLNVAILSAGKPQIAVWEIGPKVSEQLQMIDKSIGRRTKLKEIYILATASGSGLNTTYQLEPLYEDDLLDLAEEERIPLKPLTQKQRDALEPYDDSIYPVPSFKELDQIADQIA